MNNATDYNGYTNYQTWKAKLEMFDNVDILDYGISFDVSKDGFDKSEAIYELAELLKTHAEELTAFSGVGYGVSLAKDLMRGFLDKVNFLEIANLLIDEAIENL